MDLGNRFWSASLDELKKGYVVTGTDVICLLCGSKAEQERIYPLEDALYTAEGFMKRHIREMHASVFHFLLTLSKKYTGLTEMQKTILEGAYEGYSHKEIMERVSGNSPSTIRNHRFALREKQKQAKVFLAIAELVEEQKEGEEFVQIHHTARMVDERFAITQEEYEKFVEKYFPEGSRGPLTAFPRKEKRKVIILKELVKRFEQGVRYTEKEVNSILKEAYSDYVTLRRYLIEYGFMDRTPSGSEYWVC